MVERFIFSLLKKIRKLEVGYYMKRMHTGDKVLFRKPLLIRYPENIHLDNNVAINQNCTFLAHGRIVIGKNTMIGPNVTIITVNHDYHHDGINAHTAHDCLPVNIGENVWIGANATILPGVTVGNDAVIGAGSIVTKDVDEGIVVGGNPARFIKRRFE